MFNIVKVLWAFIKIYHLEVMYCQGKMCEIVQFFLRLILEMSFFLCAA